MLNYYKNLFSKYTGLLIRMDDISENMRWDYMDKCELLFDKYKIKPLLGVIPINKDPELLTYPKTEIFWDKVKDWKRKGVPHQLPTLFAHHHPLSGKDRFSCKQDPFLFFYSLLQPTLLPLSFIYFNSYYKYMMYEFN